MQCTREHQKNEEFYSGDIIDSVNKYNELSETILGNYFLNNHRQCTGDF